MRSSANESYLVHSKQYFERAKRVIPGGVHSPVRSFRGVGGVPPFIRSAKGATLTDVDGNSYIDFCMAWGPMILGHQNEEIHAAVCEALCRGWSFGAAEPVSLELAEFITERIPWVQQIRFVSSGTEAVLSAIRVARAATGRNLILKFDGCYHGHADAMLVRAGSGLADSGIADSAGIPAEVAAQTLVARLNDLPGVEQIIDVYGSRLAAIIVEPLPANNGLLVQHPEFLRGLRQLSQKCGALLIFDEVISGFRIGFGGMAERLRIEPDLVTFGKIIGGGFPVGAYGGRKDLMQWVAPQGSVYQAGTMSANPVAMAAGLATVKKLWREKPYEKLEQATKRLASRLSQKSGVTVAHYGSIFWPVWDAEQGKSQTNLPSNPEEIPSHQKARYAETFHRLLGNGFYLPPSGVEVSFLSTAHSDADFEALVDAWDR